MNGIANPFERFQLKIMEAGHDQVDSSWHRFVTFFPYYRMYYIVSGHAVIYLQDQMLELKPGHMYYVPAFSLFDAHCDQILDHYWIHFNFDATAEKYLTICPPRYEATPRPSDEAIFRLGTELARLPAEEKHLPDVVAAESLSKYLFSRFLPDEEELESSDAVRFIPVLQYIDENFSKNHQRRPERHRLPDPKLLFQSVHPSVRRVPAKIYSAKTPESRSRHAV